MENAKLILLRAGDEFCNLAKKELDLGMISHKKSLITIFGHKHKIKNFIKKFDIFHKKFQQPSILVYTWNKMANFESKLHKNDD